MTLPRRAEERTVTAVVDRSLRRRAAVVIAIRHGFRANLLYRLLEIFRLEMIK